MSAATPIERLEEEHQREGIIFGTGKVIYANQVFARPCAERSIANFLWFMKFELSFRRTEGSLTPQEERIFHADIARGERLLKIVQKRQKR